MQSLFPRMILPSSKQCLDYSSNSSKQASLHKCLNSKLSSNNLLHLLLYHSCKLLTLSKCPYNSKWVSQPCHHHHLTLYSRNQQQMLPNLFHLELRYVKEKQPFHLIKY